MSTDQTVQTRILVKSPWIQFLEWWNRLPWWQKALIGTGVVVGVFAPVGYAVAKR